MPSDVRSGHHGSRCSPEQALGAGQPERPAWRVPRLPVPYGQLWAASWCRSPALRKPPGLREQCDRVETALPSRCAPGATEGHPTSPGEELVRQRRNEQRRERQASPRRSGPHCSGCHGAPGGRACNPEDESRLKVTSLIAHLSDAPSVLPVEPLRTVLCGSECWSPWWLFSCCPL